MKRGGDDGRRDSPTCAMSKLEILQCVDALTFTLSPPATDQSQSKNHIERVPSRGFGVFDTDENIAISLGKGITMSRGLFD